MTLRGRLALLSSAAVALAVLAASVAGWFVVRSSLMDEVDQRLLEQVPDVDQIAARTVRVSLADSERAPVALLRGEPLGVQLMDQQGRVVHEVEPGDLDIGISAAERSALRATDLPAEPVLWTETIDGESYRVMSVLFGEDGFLRIIYPLENIEATLARMAWLLAGVAGAGVALACGLGWFTARAGLRPVEGLTEAAEQVAATKDLAHRIQVDPEDRDEIARLGRSVNDMLAALDEARTEQRQLVENASHELRTPLTTLRNDIGMLLRAEQHPERPLTAADREDLLAAIEVEVSSLSELVDELVDLARGETESEPPLETDLRALLERAVARNRRVSPAARVTVEAAAVVASVRPAALERAVANLVRNAVQASDQSEVVVELAEEGPEIVIRVSDRGPGLAEEEIPHLFDRFYRGAGARRHHGSGLGLAIVAQAVAQHGGSVEAANRAGGGAVFTVRLPMEPDETQISSSS